MFLHIPIHKKGKLFMYNILICDDEKDIVSALKIYLSSEGYRTFEAYNGREALEIVRKEEIHLILMDIMMPEMDGIAAMIRLREESNIPVILLTAKSEDADKILGLNVGADDYVTKPFKPAEVMAPSCAVICSSAAAPFRNPRNMWSTASRSTTKQSP